MTYNRIRLCIVKMQSSSEHVTQWLIDWGNGQEEALHKLIPVVYDELRRMAMRHMRKENTGHTLQTTALVNETYLKLIDQKKVHWQNRAHFFGIASQMMRRILVDHARAHARAKRGAHPLKLTLDEAAVVSQQRVSEFVLLDDALSALAKVDAQKSRIVEMKFFGGLSMEEIAAVENVSVRTIGREWRKARAWLYREVKKGNEI